MDSGSKRTKDTLPARLKPGLTITTDVLSIGFHSAFRCTDCTICVQVLHGCKCLTRSRVEPGLSVSGSIETTHAERCLPYSHPYVRMCRCAGFTCNAVLPDAFLREDTGTAPPKISNR